MHNHEWADRTHQSYPFLFGNLLIRKRNTDVIIRVEPKLNRILLMKPETGLMASGL